MITTTTSTSTDGVSLLCLEEVAKSFSGAPVLRGSMSMALGEHVALIGPSGCGKSTLLHLISGVLRPDSGSIRLSDTIVSELPEERLDLFRARHIGYVFQAFHLLEGLTVRENVEIALTFAGRRDYHEAETILAGMGLRGRLDYFPRQLSVGQRQRVAVARALVNRPSLLLADEPTANLDSERADEVMSLLRDTCRQSQAALLVVTHDKQGVHEFDRVVDFSQQFAP